jgi:hypothetical protein
MIRTPVRPGLNIGIIARVAHETNRAYCFGIGDNSQKRWDEAEQWQRDSAVKGVEFALANPDGPASAQHDAWLADKVRDGWVYGVEKNAELKTHPCLVPYLELPLEQRVKDYLFRHVVAAFVDAAAGA